MSTTPTAPGPQVRCAQIVWPASCRDASSSSRWFSATRISDHPALRHDLKRRPRSGGPADPARRIGHHLFNQAIDLCSGPALRSLDDQGLIDRVGAGPTRDRAAEQDRPLRRGRRIEREARSEATRPRCRARQLPRVRGGQSDGDRTPASGLATESSWKSSARAAASSVVCQSESPTSASHSSMMITGPGQWRGRDTGRRWSRHRERGFGGDDRSRPSSCAKAFPSMVLPQPGLPGQEHARSGP